jgi:hypothetical protein
MVFIPIRLIPWLLIAGGLGAAAGAVGASDGWAGGIGIGVAVAAWAGWLWFRDWLPGYRVERKLSKLDPATRAAYETLAQERVRYGRILTPAGRVLGPEFWAAQEEAS